MANFIPQIWSARINKKNEENYVILQNGLINRDYEGEIAQAGDTVKITSIGAITVSDYTGADLGAPQELTTDQVSLVINQAKAFNFSVDDVEIAQANLPLVDQAAENASNALTEKAELYVTGLYTGFHTDNFVGTDVAPVAITAENVFDKLVDLGTKLDAKSTPRNGRFIIVDPVLYGVLLKAKTIQLPDYTGTIRNGEVGKVAGFTVFTSNNIVHGTGFKHAIAGHPSGWTYAEQIAQVKMYEPENSFKQAVKGLHLYGAKVVKKENLAVLTFTV